jgi:hypothetical protein
MTSKTSQPVQHGDIITAKEREAREALQALFVGVDQSIADILSAKIEAYIAELKAPRSISDLPAWKACQTMAESGTAGDLEHFIYENEPADEYSSEEFRSRLRKLLSSKTSIAGA